MPSLPPSHLADRGTVLALFAGPIRSLRSPRAPGGPATAWRSAILKHRLDAMTVGVLGAAGDDQKEKKHHGGTSKALLIYGAGHYEGTWAATMPEHASQHATALRAMSKQHDASQWGFGAFGENLTIAGLTERIVCLGDLWQIGECRLRITEPRGPCTTLTRRWMRPALLGEVKSTAAAGWYNAVEQAGTVTAGDAAVLLERPQEEFSLERVFHLLEGSAARRADIEQLCAASYTHDGLRQRLERRLATPGRTRD